MGSIFHRYHVHTYRRELGKCTSWLAVPSAHREFYIPLLLSFALLGRDRKVLVIFQVGQFGSRAHCVQSSGSRGEWGAGG